MKRSIMVKEIEDVVLFIRYSSQIPTKEVADHILRKIELLGMIPGFDCGYTHEWEPEDEKK